MLKNNRKYHTIEKLEHFKIWAHFMPKQPCKITSGFLCYPQIDLEFCWECFNEMKKEEND